MSLTAEERTEAQRDQDFSLVRTAGTFGWIVAGLILTAYLHWKKPVTGQTVPLEEMQLTAIFGLIRRVPQLSCELVVGLAQDRQTVRPTRSG